MNFTDYDVILVNSSAGKDSQAMLTLINEWAESQGVRERIVVVHCDLGRVEWKGTRELAEEQARHYGNRFEVVRRRKGDLLEQVEARGMWPSSAARYCTSDQKRAQVCRVLTQLTSEIESPGRRVRILNCMGIRAQESAARAKKEAFIADDPTYSNKTVRQVDTWLPLFHWTEESVWQTIRQSGVSYHYAYDLGDATAELLLLHFRSTPGTPDRGRAHPELLAEYVRIEQKIGHKFRVDQTLIEIQTAHASGERATAVNHWMQCA